MEMTVLCECSSFDCDESIELLLEEAQVSKADNDLVIIVSSCKYGPDKTDILVEAKNGYAIYRDTNVL